MMDTNGRGEMVDWCELGIKFRQLGYGSSDVARALNLPWSTVNDWFILGKEPRYSSGALLLGLYRRVASERTNRLVSAKA